VILAAVLVVVSILNPPLDACACADAGGTWFSLPDVCCWREGQHPKNPMDGIVDVQDFLFLLAQWGPCPPGECCLGDLNRDRVIGVADMLLIIEHWGQHPATFVRCRDLP
jgi:hypothetical protein